MRAYRYLGVFEKVLLSSAIERLDEVQKRILLGLPRLLGVPQDTGTPAWP